MKTITVTTFNGVEKELNLAEYIARWDNVTDVGDLKSLCHTTSVDEDIYTEELNQIENRLEEIKNELLFLSFKNTSASTILS